jgi:2-polyprenyl-3-methyl-5-hydroxy-6-metoxy-1,4-benzoquinol methylase
MTSEEQRAPDCCCGEREARIARHFDGRDFSDAPALHETSAQLLAQLRDVVELHPTVLELGSGAGALAVALVEDGAARATGLDLSPISVEAARRHADAAGVAEHASFGLGNAAIADLEPHDWVVMDRIICCYGDMDRLLGNALPAVRGRLAFSVPESRGLRGLVNHVLWRMENLLDLFRSDSCKGHVHDIRRMHRRMTSAGLRLRSERLAGLWYTAVFERVSALEAAPR